MRSLNIYLRQGSNPASNIAWKQSIDSQNFPETKLFLCYPWIHMTIWKSYLCSSSSTSESWFKNFNLLSLLSKNSATNNMSKTSRWTLLPQFKIETRVFWLLPSPLPGVTFSAPHTPCFPMPLPTLIFMSAGSGVLDQVRQTLQTVSCIACFFWVCATCAWQ